MEHLKIPLSDTEEAVYQLMRQVHALQDENEKLKEQIKQLKWSLTEQD
jgi:cell division septum initiation protein DivIVA